MNQDTIVSFLKAMGAVNIEPHRAGGKVTSSCPLRLWEHTRDGKPPTSQPFVVFEGPGLPMCRCMTCHYKGPIDKLAFKAQMLNKAEPFAEIDWSRVYDLIDAGKVEGEWDFDSIPSMAETLAASAKNKLVEFPEWYIKKFRKAWEVPMALHYLEDRGVTVHMAEYLGLLWHPLDFRVCFPIRDFKGVLRGVHGRAIDPGEKLRYLMYDYDKKTNSVVWLGEHWVDLTRPILIVEGPFDLASCLRVYPNVVSPLFATPSLAKLKRMEGAFEWWTLLDHGPAGDKGRESIQMSFGATHKLVHLRPPEGVKDPGEMSEGQLHTILAPLLG